MHIAEVKVGGSDERGEWVCIFNDTLTPVRLCGATLSDSPSPSNGLRVYTFGPDENGTPIVLRPGERAFVFTRTAEEGWFDTDDGSRAILLSMGLENPIWEVGDSAYLHDEDGVLVDSHVVGQRMRHSADHDSAL